MQVLFHFLLKTERKGGAAGEKKEVLLGCQAPPYTRRQAELHVHDLISSRHQGQVHSHPLLYRGGHSHVTWPSLTDAYRELLNKGATAWVPAEERLIFIWVVLVQWVKGNSEAESILNSCRDVSVTLSQGAMLRFTLCFSLIFSFSERGAKTSLQWLLWVMETVGVNPPKHHCFLLSEEKAWLTFCTIQIIRFLDNVVAWVVRQHLKRDTDFLQS